MNRCKYLIYGALLVSLITGAAGCARAARDTTGFEMVDSVTVDAPLMDVWQTTKTVLREKELQIYTRDKRGVFVAYTPSEKRFFLKPERTRYTITLEENPGDDTKVTVETIQQAFGVTLLTYPGWHDRKTMDNAMTLAILDAVKTRCEARETDNS
jgi:hypothetical protein